MCVCACMPDLSLAGMENRKRTDPSTLCHHRYCDQTGRVSHTHPCTLACRSNSPHDRCRKPRYCSSNTPRVPLPAPGGPNSTKQGGRRECVAPRCISWARSTGKRVSRGAGVSTRVGGKRRTNEQAENIRTAVLVEPKVTARH